MHNQRIEQWQHQHTFNIEKLSQKLEKYYLLPFDKDEENDAMGNWNHITGMTMLSCTQKGIDILEKEKVQVEEKYNYYKQNKPWQIWLDDLEEFLKEYPKYLKDNPIDQKDKK